MIACFRAAPVFYVLMTVCFQGRPAVHADTDLIVGHIAITVDSKRMEELRIRLKQLGVPARRNVSVPNPADQSTSSGKVSQVK